MSTWLSIRAGCPDITSKKQANRVVEDILSEFNIDSELVYDKDNKFEFKLENDIEIKFSNTKGSNHYWGSKSRNYGDFGLKISYSETHMIEGSKFMEISERIQEMYKFIKQNTDYETLFFVSAERE